MLQRFERELSRPQDVMLFGSLRAGVAEQGRAVSRPVRMLHGKCTGCRMAEAMRQDYLADEIGGERLNPLANALMLKGGAECADPEVGMT